MPRLSLDRVKQNEEIILQDVQDGNKEFIGYKLSFNNPKFKADFSIKAFDILNKKINEKKEIYKTENRITTQGNLKVPKSKKGIQWQMHENNPANIYWCKLGNDTLISIIYNQVIQYDDPEVQFSVFYNSAEVYSLRNKEYVTFDQMFNSDLKDNIQKLITKVTKDRARKNLAANYPNLSVDQMVENYELSTLMFEDKWAFTPTGVEFISIPADQVFGPRSSLYIILPYESLERYLRK